MAPKPKPLPDRFWSKVDKNGPGGCWLWTGYIGPNGYGRFTTHNSRSEYAHRVSWTLMNGPIPPGHHIDHRCKVHACVNSVDPEHLRTVLPVTNVTENSDSLQARNAAATHCVNGHPFDEENTYFRRDGRRDCKACKREREANRSPR